MDYPRTRPIGNDDQKHSRNSIIHLNDRKEGGKISQRHCG